jgi:hypothetical protein
MKLFKRSPKLFWHPGKPDPVISREVQRSYPALEDDFKTLDRVLVPIFQQIDEQALRVQNQFRLWQVYLILGGTLATILGALQATFSTVPWWGIAEAVLAVILATVTGIVRQLKFQEKYFHFRLKAEVLRREYFLFLGRVAPYDQDESRVKRLAIWVEQIESEGDL